MFDILVYLYETYYRPDACPEPAVLARKLSAVGFDDVEISEALVWLTDLNAMAGVPLAAVPGDDVAVGQHRPHRTNRARQICGAFSHAPLFGFCSFRSSGREGLGKLSHIARAIG